MDKTNEEFTASYGVNAKVPGPVDTGNPHANRPADKKQGDMVADKIKMSKSGMISDMVKAAYKMPAGSLAGKYKTFMDSSDAVDASAKNLATVTVKEDMDAMFDGEELSEQFRERAEALFEARVSARLGAVQASLEEEYAVKLDEALASVTNQMVDTLDQYLEMVAEKWLEENRVAVESGIRAEITESFLTGMRSLFTEHYIDVPADKVDVVEALAGEVEELRSKLDESINHNLQLNQKLEEMNVAEAFAEMTESLTASEVEKLAVLAEGIEYSNVDEFRKKLGYVIENFTASSKEAVSKASSLEEAVELVEEAHNTAPAADPAIAALAQRISSKNAAAR